MDKPTNQAKKTSKKKYIRYSLYVLLSLFGIAIAYFIWWGLTPLGPSTEALDALKGNEQVAVSNTQDTWVFTPKNTTATTGYIFYPGGHVDARSYAIYASEVAEQGYIVVIPVMPFSLAVFGIDRANTIIDANPQIQHWAIGGHSLGGAMAASYAASNPNKVIALVLLAAYPAGGADLTKSGLKVVSIYGTLDTVLNRSSLEAGRSLLPADTTYSVLNGGNHAQFGSYGLQPGDTSKPTMNAHDQRAAAVAATNAILK